VLEIDNAQVDSIETSIASINPASGNVGIGTVDPFGGKLIIASGNVGIGSSDPRQVPDVQGTIRFSNLIGNISVYDNGNSSTSKTVGLNNATVKDHHDGNCTFTFTGTDGDRGQPFLKI